MAVPVKRFIVEISESTQIRTTSTKPPAPKLLDLITFIVSDCLSLGSVLHRSTNIYTLIRTQNVALLPQPLLKWQENSNMQMINIRLSAFFLRKPSLVLYLRSVTVSVWWQIPLIFPIVSGSHVGKLAFYFKKILLST